MTVCLCPTRLPIGFFPGGDAIERVGVLASTSNVYGAHSVHPGREDDVVDPKLAYPASKFAVEKALRESGLNRAVLRFAFVYGDQDGHLDELPKQAVAGKWHPAKRISTIHHRDIATAIRLALDSVFDGHIVNISYATSTPHRFFGCSDLRLIYGPSNELTEEYLTSSL